MQRIPIERKTNLTLETFARDHLQNGGKPVIVTDATDQWPARSKWTLEYFKSAYGSDFARAPLGLHSDVAKMTRLSAYIDYLDTPSAELPGFWVDARDGKPLRTAPSPRASPHYLLGWYAFQKHPELYEDIKPGPYFVADWLLALDPIPRDLFEWLSGRDCWSIYIGPEGALSQLHQDFWNSHAYLAQIQGRKRALLFAPADTPYLYHGQVDPERPDFARFALLERAVMHECVLEPGEVLFVPAGWWHCVRGLDKTITVSHNFFNDINVNELLARLLRKLPRLVQGLDRFPQWRESFGIEWCSRGFADSKP